jgi:hypothetical protein
VTVPDAYISFRHRFNTEEGWDGGTFYTVINGYSVGLPYLANEPNSRLRGTDNPLENADGWSGNSNGYITTIVQLPNHYTSGYDLQLYWHSGHDSDSSSPGTWRIDNVQVYSGFAANTNQITIPGGGAASPYPSEIPLTRYYGAVSEVVVKLENFSHNAPDDVDLMLVAPNGRKVMLMSDAGGGNPAQNLNLTFDDSAAGYLPDESPLQSGVYKPSNYGSDADSFPAPAPGGAPASTLAAFFGGFPQGTYKLFLVDDNGNNVGGAISGGWKILVKTSATACPLTLTPSPQVFASGGGAGILYVTTPAGCSWIIETQASASFVTFTSPATGDGSGTVNFNVAPFPFPNFRTGWMTGRTPSRFEYFWIAQQGI